MITAHLVTIPLTDESLLAHRRIELAVVPRVGEYITQNDRDGVGQAFNVVAVLHPANPDPGTTASVELHVSHVGIASELHRSLAGQGSGWSGGTQPGFGGTRFGS